MNVTSRYLLEGALYSLEQCGLLLRDAAILYEMKSYSSSVVLSAFAREELGKGKILVTMFEEMVNNQRIHTVTDIKNRFGDHVARQLAARLSVTLSASIDTHLGKLMQDSFNYRPGSEEYMRINEEIHQAIDAKRKRLPHERHRDRMKSLYVDPDDSGRSWNVPKNISADFAFNFLIEASNDYAAFCQLLQLETSQHKEFTEELLKWENRPTILPPSWPQV